MGDLLRVLFHHDVTVDEDGAHDGEGEEGVAEHVDGNSRVGNISSSAMVAGFESLDPERYIHYERFIIT